MRKELNIGNLPGRKSKTLSITEFHDEGGATIRPLAYFRSEDAYREFVDHIRGKGSFKLETEGDTQ